jgi:hypothetical protein
VLLGDWGGEGLGIRATVSTVTIDMPCDAWGVHPTPVTVGADGTFSFEITIHQLFGDFEAIVSGRMVHDRFLEARVAAQYIRPPMQPYLLLEGMEPDFSGYVCLQ